MVAKTTQPCFWSFAILPNVYVNANGMASNAQISKTFVIGLGFSYGCDGVGVERAAAVLADLLDRLLARDRPTRDGLLLAGHRRHRLGGMEVLDDALAQQERARR